MDEKTEELRDIFLDVAEEGSVTESQSESRGSLASDPDAVDDRLEATVGRLRERFGFATDLPDAAYVAVVRGFYDDRSDAEIATDLDAEADAATVARARHDCHLVRDADTADLDLDTIRRRHDAGEDPAEIATNLDCSPAAVECALGAIGAEQRSQRVSHRFRDAFEAALTDADLAVRLTADAEEDGLGEAVADAEVDVDL